MRIDAIMTVHMMVITASPPAFAIAFWRGSVSFDGLNDE
jgi:hypothetical protein